MPMTRAEIDSAKRNWAGLLFISTNRDTGTTCGVYLSADAGLDTDTKYNTVCEDHATCIGTDNQVMARYSAAYPSEWCDDCRAIRTEKEN